jgi:cell division protein FtsB
MRWLIAFGLCIGLLSIVAGDRGLPALRKARRDTQTVALEIAALKAENAALRARAEALRHDPRAIEMVARENLGMARAGEIVIRRTGRPNGRR